MSHHLSLCGEEEVVREASAGLSCTHGGIDSKVDFKKLQRVDKCIRAATNDCFHCGLTCRLFFQLND